MSLTVKWSKVHSVKQVRAFAGSYETAIVEASPFGMGDPKTHEVQVTFYEDAARFANRCAPKGSFMCNSAEDAAHLAEFLAKKLGL